VILLIENLIIAPARKRAFRWQPDAAITSGPAVGA
jgi:hypothetical protein